MIHAKSSGMYISYIEHIRVYTVAVYYVSRKKKSHSVFMPHRILHFLRDLLTFSRAGKCKSINTVNPTCINRIYTNNIIQYYLYMLKTVYTQENEYTLYYVVHIYISRANVVVAIIFNRKGESISSGSCAAVFITDITDTFLCTTCILYIHGRGAYCEKLMACYDYS